MQTRTLYFIRDTVTGKYIIARSLQFGDFRDAVIHTTVNSVTDGIKTRARIYKSYLKWTDEDVKLESWRRLARGWARKRENLPDFGLEMVTVVVSEN